MSNEYTSHSTIIRNILSENTLDESTKAYGDALKQIAKDRQLRKLSKKDRDTLIKIADLLKKEDLEENDTVAGDIAGKDIPMKMTKRDKDELEEAFVIDKGAKVAMKLKNGKMIYGKVLKQQRVLGKAGVEVQWSDGTKGRFPTDKFSALSMDSKADYKIEETELEEANTDKYMWKDINKALMAAGVNPRTIMKVTAGLRGKAIKEEVEEEVNEALKPGPIDPRTLAGKIITGEVKLLTVDQSSPGARQTYILATGKPSTMGAPPDSIYIDATGSRPRGSGLAIGFRLSEVKKAEIKRDGSARVSLK